MRLLIVTDIHGRPSANHCLSRRLPGVQQSLVRTVSVSELLGVDDTGERLHRDLVENDGFIRAAKRLLGLVEFADVALGYSAGGTVLWHSVLHGLAVGRLLCISSTRLRAVNASTMPKPALVVFGENDPNRPPVAGQEARLCKAIQSLTPVMTSTLSKDPRASCVLPGSRASSTCYSCRPRQCSEPIDAAT